jgi:transposase
VERPSTAAAVRVCVGIDAAVSADHNVCVRQTAADGSASSERFRVAPTAAGLERLSRRLSALPAGTLVVAEPTSMTWLGLAAAAEQAGCGFALIGARHSSRLRSAIMGKNKSDVIDADVIARAPEVFDLAGFHAPSPQELALRRAVTRRQAAVIDANRAYRRLVSLARWAFPDVWIAFAGSLPTALAVLRRWPDIRALASARRSTVTALVAEHTRAVPDVPARAEAVRAAAAAWAAFWQGRLDLDALAWEVAEQLRDYDEAQARVARATQAATAHWEADYGSDPLLLSVPGIGPVTAPVVRAYLGDGTRFASGKKAANYAGLAPSSWASGTVSQPSRAITKEGPAALRLAFYQAANGARRTDPQLADFYHRLMTSRGHCHTQATIAVARKLAERTWLVLTTGRPYELRGPDGTPITERAAQALIAERYTVDPATRARARAHSAATHRGKLTR